MQMKKGISLIILIIIIVIMLILLTSIVLSMKNSDVTTSSLELRVKSNVSSINEELQNYISHQEAEYAKQGIVYQKENLNANDEIATYGDENLGTIDSILPSISKARYNGAFRVENGILVLTENYDFTDQEKEWINEVLNK